MSGIAQSIIQRSALGMRFILSPRQPACHSLLDAWRVHIGHVYQGSKIQFFDYTRQKCPSKEGCLTLRPLDQVCGASYLLQMGEKLALISWWRNWRGSA